MGGMSITNNVNNGVNGAGTNGEGPAASRCPRVNRRVGQTVIKRMQSEKSGPRRCYGMLFLEQSS